MKHIWQSTYLIHNVGAKVSIPQIHDSSQNSAELELNHHMVIICNHMWQK